MRQLLATAGFPEGTDLDRLSGARELRHGRRVLLEECTFCHDLRTAISRPRTPADWVRTVQRMAEKPTLGPRIGPEEAHAAAAYLVAITPELQRSAKSKRAEDMEKEEAVQAAADMNDEGDEAGEAADTGADAEKQAGAGKGGDKEAAVDGRKKAASGAEPAVASAEPKPKKSPPDPAAAKKAVRADLLQVPRPRRRGRRAAAHRRAGARAHQAHGGERHGGEPQGPRAHPLPPDQDLRGEEVGRAARRGPSAAR